VTEQGWMEHIRCKLTGLKRHGPSPEQAGAGYDDLVSYPILLTMVPDISKNRTTQRFSHTGLPAFIASGRNIWRSGRVTWHGTPCFL